MPRTSGRDPPTCSFAPQHRQADIFAGCISHFCSSGMNDLRDASFSSSRPEAALGLFLYHPSPWFRALSPPSLCLGRRFRGGSALLSTQSIPRTLASWTHSPPGPGRADLCVRPCRRQKSHFDPMPLGAGAQTASGVGPFQKGFPTSQSREEPGSFLLW